MDHPAIIYDMLLPAYLIASMLIGALLGLIRSWNTPNERLQSVYIGVGAGIICAFIVIGAFLLLT